MCDVYGVRTRVYGRSGYAVLSPLAHAPLRRIEGWFLNEPFAAKTVRFQEGYALMAWRAAGQTGRSLPPRGLRSCFCTIFSMQNKQLFNKAQQISIALMQAGGMPKGNYFRELLKQGS